MGENTRSLSAPPVSRSEVTAPWRGCCTPAGVAPGVAVGETAGPGSTRRRAWRWRSWSSCCGPARRRSSASPRGTPRDRRGARALRSPARGAIDAERARLAGAVGNAAWGARARVRTTRVPHRPASTRDIPTRSRRSSRTRPRSSPTRRPRTTTARACFPPTSPARSRGRGGSSRRLVRTANPTEPSGHGALPGMHEVSRRRRRGRGRRHRAAHERVGSGDERPVGPSRDGRPRRGAT